MLAVRHNGAVIRLAVTVLPLLAVLLPAQADRYELGLRLRAFERRLADCTDAGRRDGAFQALDRAVQAFFRLDTATVARAVDGAERALAGTSPSPEQRFAASLSLALDARLAVTGEAALRFEVRAVYRERADEQDEDSDDLPLPAGMSLVVAPLAAAGAPQRFALDELPFAGSLSLAAVPPGDHVLRWSIVRGDDVLLQREQGLSIAADLDARLAKLRAEVERRGDSAAPTIEERTLPSLVQKLDGMRRRRAEETVLPGARLLAEAEALLAADGPYYGAERPGDFWLRVPTATGTESVRLFVPPGAKTPQPLVIAVHGAGGSENLFFDGYGDGEVVRQAASRGWFVTAPRCGFGTLDCAALADALAERFPIDLGRVVLVGHSMGAMQVIGNASKTPARWAAVAALSGGGGLRRSDALVKVPFYVGVGSRDFARSQGRRLHQELEQLGATSTLREYEGVEHLAIVQLALPDVFAFFDRALAAKQK